MALYEFKPDSGIRGARLQMLEDKFGNGMQFTNTPLVEGFSRVLVNYDLMDSGVALTPRPGLEATQLFIPTDTSGATTIACAKEQSIGATEKRMQLLSIAKREDNGYDLRVITGVPALIEHTVVANDTLYDSVEWHNYRVSDPIKVFCRVPESAEIHGLPVNNETLAIHPGVYAWNEAYYFFDAVNNKIVHTIWDVATEKFIFQSDSPKGITPKEAVSYGYNMLLAQPYHFANTEGAAGSVIAFLGLMPYDAANNLCLTPLVNQSLTFEAFYQVPLNKRYYIVVEWKSTSDSVWTEITHFDTTFTTVGTIKFPFSPPNDNLIMRITAYGYTGEVRNTYTDAVLAVGFSFDRKAYGATANITPKTFTLASATGMTYWKNRLIIWGVPEDQSILFSSEVNDPSYFPYPNNTDTFDEPIKYAKPFLDNLLVWTATRLWMLTLSADGLTWSKKCIQNNLTIADWDIHLIQVVKNMVFFRSGNYYYMIVPKSGSLTGELTLAPVTKPMYYFFDKFEQYTKEIIEQMFAKNNVSFTLKQYYNYLDFEDVHNVYVLQITDTGEYLNFDMLYNTVARVWRIYITGSSGIMLPYKQDMTQNGILCEASVQNGKTVYQLLRYNNRNNQDFYNIDYSSLTPMALFETNHAWHNWQGIDTGYREHNSNFKKRYRECQFIINNRSNQPLNFYTDFFIDGEQRRNKYKYNIVQNTDPESPDFGAITVEQVLAAPLTTPSATTLDTWELGVSMFPDTSFCKIRFPVSGKGYTPRMLLISRNELPYELLNTSWVYRSMYSR